MTPMNPAVVAIAGPIGSGKTTTADLLARQLAWPQAGYGDTIRAIATRRGLPASRDSLQQLGLDLISNGWDAFTALVLQHARWVPGQPLILDGLRHLPAATALRTAVAPLPVIIIYLDLPAAIAANRARQRDQDTRQPAADSAAHATELRYLASALGRAPGGRCA
jgi:dephospho-CoA kinase